MAFLAVCEVTVKGGMRGGLKKILWGREREKGIQGVINMFCVTANEPISRPELHQTSIFQIYMVDG